MQHLYLSFIVLNVACHVYFVNMTHLMHMFYKEDNVIVQLEAKKYVRWSYIIIAITEKGWYEQCVSSKAPRHILSFWLRMSQTYMHSFCHDFMYICRSHSLITLDCSILIDFSWEGQYGNLNPMLLLSCNNDI